MVVAAALVLVRAAVAVGKDTQGASQLSLLGVAAARRSLRAGPPRRRSRSTAPSPRLASALRSARGPRAESESRRDLDERLVQNSHRLRAADAKGARASRQTPTPRWPRRPRATEPRPRASSLESSWTSSRRELRSANWDCCWSLALFALSGSSFSCSSWYKSCLVLQGFLGTMPSAQTKILWLRKTLRMHDNPTLKACMEDASTVLPVYVLDKWHSNPQNVGDVRFEFIMESLRNLDEKFKKCGVDTGVIFVRGEPEKVLPKIWEAVDAKAIGFDTSEEAEKHSQKTDEDVASLANKADVKVIDEPAHWMHPPGLYERHMNGGEVPTTMSSFETLFSQCGSVREPLTAPKSIPYDEGTADKALDAIRKALDVEDLTVPKSGDNKFYKGLKREQRKLRFPGGEDEALKRLEKVVEKQPDWVASFEKPKTAPTGLEPQTTVLSPYLNAGCLSLRRAWHAVKKAEKDAKGKPTQPPTSLAGQLLWREHWLTIGYFTEEDISKMKGNPLARQIDWDWNNDAKELFAKWEAGETGYPFIDAIMTQLREEGWIHHLARHMVACFLTRGDCFVSWEKGFDVFDRLLIDADWSVNSCNWMWLSCSAFFYQYFRCYSPISFGKKWDPDGDYIRKYVPALKDMPKKYIYEPWKAPREVQEEAKCIIGKDYPERIIEDHTATSKENMNRIKEAYDRYKSGNKRKSSASSDSSGSSKKQSKKN